jgi:hypothetical protein
MYPKSMRVGQTFSVTIQVFDLVKNLAVTASLQKPGSRGQSVVTDDILFKKGKFCWKHLFLIITLNCCLLCVICVCSYVKFKVDIMAKQLTDQIQSNLIHIWSVQFGNKNKSFHKNELQCFFLFCRNKQWLCGAEGNYDSYAINKYV